MVRVAFPFYSGAGISQGKDLGVRFSGLWMVAAAHYFVVLDEDAADLGVGSRGVGRDLVVGSLHLGLRPVYGPLGVHCRPGHRRV